MRKRIAIKKALKLITSGILILMLTSCAGFGGGTTHSNSPDIDLNADVEAIASGVSRFDANTASTSSASTLEDYINLSNNNESILDSIAEAVQQFKQDIKSAWNDLPAEDTDSSPSRAKLLNWAEGYETWIYYQRESQKLGSACVVTSQSKSEFEMCSISNLNRTLEFEKLSKEDLSAAIQGIQEWRQSVGANNG